MSEATSKKYLLGFYLGVGDFVSAMPTINALLQDGQELVIVASPVNIELANAILFASDRFTMIPFEPFSIARPLKLAGLIRELSRFRFDAAFVSPHALHSVPSWKIPLLMSMLRWVGRFPVLIGATGEKFSGLFSKALEIDPTRNLMHREWQLHQRAGTITCEREPDLKIFRREYRDGGAAKRYDLVIHPGASRQVRKWPKESYADLLDRLDTKLSVCFLGLPDELSPLDNLEKRDNVCFRSGSILDAVRTVAAARVTITMDSGFSHVAAFLGVDHIAIFGSADPTITPPLSERSQVLFYKQLPCQPCGQYECKLGHIACMKTVTPNMVADQIERLLQPISDLTN